MKFFIFLLLNKVKLEIKKCSCIIDTENNNKICNYNMLECEYPKNNNFMSIIFLILILTFWCFILPRIMFLVEKILFIKYRDKYVYDKFINIFINLKIKIKNSKVLPLKNKKKKISEIQYEILENNNMKIKLNKSNSIIQKIDRFNK